MSEYALRLANSQDTAARVRAGDALGLTPNGAVRARGGVRPDGGGVVSVVTGTMSVQVTPFSGWVDASPVGQVGYPFVCDATKTLAIAAGHATLVRVDTVAVVVKENVFDGSGATAATLQIVQGTPGAGAPAMPTSACIPLRDINVPAGASTGTGGLSSGALGADRRTYVVGSGGVLPVASQAERDALAAKDGWAVYRKDADVIEVFNGSGWDRYSPDGGAWTSYVPAWTSAGTNPTIGNGTIAGAYRQVGKTVHFRIRVQVGTTTTFGSGAWSLSLPVPAAEFAAVVGMCNVTGSSARYAVAGWIDASISPTTITRMTTQGNSPGIDAAQPAVWTANAANFLIVSGTYDAA